MAEQLFFGLGIANNPFLILIFLIRKTHGTAALQRIGQWYFLLAVSGLWDGPGSPGA
jgi:hypothetical protein